MHSNGQGFYITLPSESSKDLFPENNPSEYIVRLPHWVQLKGEWGNRITFYSLYAMEHNPTPRRGNIPSHILEVMEAKEGK